jgi:hypothetical protein
VVLAVLWQAGAPPAPPPPTGAAAQSDGESWGSPDGGAVVIKPGGRAYSVLITDVSDNSSLFSEGRVVSRTERPDGSHSYLLKPTTPGQAGWTLEVIAKPDGTAEIYLTKGGVRHLAAPLKK